MCDLFLTFGGFSPEELELLEPFTHQSFEVVVVDHNPTQRTSLTRFFKENHPDAKTSEILRSLKNGSLQWVAASWEDAVILVRKLNLLGAVAEIRPDLYQGLAQRYLQVLRLFQPTAAPVPTVGPGEKGMP